jgi:hypothetical protein
MTELSLRKFGGRLNRRHLGRRPHDVVHDDTNRVALGVDRSAGVRRRPRDNSRLRSNPSSRHRGVREELVPRMKLDPWRRKRTGVIDDRSWRTPRAAECPARRSPALYVTLKTSKGRWHEKAPWGDHAQGAQRAS